MVGLKTVTYTKILSTMVNPRDIAGERRRRGRRRMVIHRDIAKNTEEEKEW